MKLVILNETGFAVTPSSSSTAALGGAATLVPKLALNLLPQQTSTPATVARGWCLAGVCSPCILLTMHRTA